MEKTFIMIKPEALKAGKQGEIIDLLIKNRFGITKMKQFSIETLAKIIKADPTTNPNGTFTGVSIDSRTTQPGDCFFAIMGSAYLETLTKLHCRTSGFLLSQE